MLKENAGQKTQLIYKKLKPMITENFQSNFKVILRIRTIKPTWWNTFSKKWRELLPCVLSSCQTIYLANLDGATKSWNHWFLLQPWTSWKKVFVFIKFVCDKDISSFVWTGSSLFRQTLMWLWYLYIKMSLALHS